MANKYNITMKQYNGTDYDTLNPTTFPEPSVQAKYFNNPTGNETTNDALNLLSNAVLFTRPDMIEFYKSGSVSFWSSGFASNANTIAAFDNNNPPTSFITYEGGAFWKGHLIDSSMHPQKLYWAGDKFIAITSNIDSYNIVTYYSNNGDNWTKGGNLPFGSSAYSNIPQICYGNGEYVAVLPNTTLTAYSNDGIQWASGGNLPTNATWTMQFGNGRFIAIGRYTAQNTGAYSTDGINWSSFTLPATGVDYSMFKFVNDRFILTQSSSTNYWYSTDGINWTSATLPISASYKDIAYGDEKYCMTYTYPDSGYLISKDGVNWIKGTGTENPYGDIFFLNGQWISPPPSSTAKIAYSINKIMLSDVKGNVLGEVTLS